MCVFTLVFIFLLLVLARCDVMPRQIAHGAVQTRSQSTNRVPACLMRRVLLLTTAC